MTPASKSRGYLGHPFWQAVAIMVFAYVLLAFIVPLLPGSAIVPKSVLFQYMCTVLVGVLIYVSDNATNAAAKPAVIFVSNVAPARAPNAAWLLPPPNALAMSPPLPCCNRITRISSRQTNT